MTVLNSGFISPKIEQSILKENSSTGLLLRSLREF